MMIGFRVCAVTFGTWKLRTRPSRSTNDQRENSFLGRNLALAVRGLAADESLIALDNLIRAAERAGINPEIAHCLANTMPEEPGSFQTAIEGALKLAGADAFFRRTEQIDGLEPNPHRHVAGLKHGADLDGEGLAASVALAKANPVGLAPQPADLLLGCAAMRADRAIRPEPRFDVLIGGFFVMKVCGGKDGSHGLSP